MQLPFSYNSKICYQAKQSLPFEITYQHNDVSKSWMTVYYKPQGLEWCMQEEHLRQDILLLQSLQHNKTTK